MVYRIRPESIKDAKQGIKDSNRAGFAVTDIRSKPKDPGNPKLNPAKDFIDEVWMTTPYLYDGYPLMAFCTVERGNIQIDRTEKLAISDVELWTVDRVTGKPDRNLEDIYENDHGTRDWTVQDLQGWDATHEDVEKHVADCAAATVTFPHVLHYDEYMAFQKLNFARLRLGQPTDTSYSNYLKHCESMMRSGDMPYVGELRDPDRVNLRNLEIPSTQRGYEEWAADIQNEDDGMNGPN